MRKSRNEFLAAKPSLHEQAANNSQSRIGMGSRHASGRRSYGMKDASEFDRLSRISYNEEKLSMLSGERLSDHMGFWASPERYNADAQPL